MYKGYLYADKNTNTSFFLNNGILYNTINIKFVLFDGTSPWTDDLNNKAYHGYIWSLSGTIYNYDNMNKNNITIINIELSSTIYNDFNKTVATQYNIWFKYWGW